MKKINFMFFYLFESKGDIAAKKLIVFIKQFFDKKAIGSLRFLIHDEKNKLYVFCTCLIFSKGDIAATEKFFFLKKEI